MFFKVVCSRCVVCGKGLNSALTAAQFMFRIQHDNRERMLVYTLNKCWLLLIAKTGQMYTITTHTK